jgi:hypothetical protein
LPPAEAGFGPENRKPNVLGAFHDDADTATPWCVATTRTIFVDDGRRLVCRGSAGYFPVQGRNDVVALDAQSGSTKNRL